MKALRAPQRGSIIAPSKVVLEEIGLDPRILKQLKSHSKQAKYRAAINGLADYEPPLDASNLEHVQGYVDAFNHLCQAEDWDKAKKMLLICLNTPTHDDLGTQLGTWGYLEEQAQMYGKLY